MLQVTHLGFDYAQCPLLKRVSFNVPAGTLLHLQGANGSGKTTLLKLLAGLFLPAEGEIHFQGNPIQHDKVNYQRQLCYLGHKPGISLSLSPRENCYVDLQYRELQSLDWAMLMSTLSLTGLEDTPCSQLSAGQRRRAALLRLFISDAKLWLLDEPLVALDSQAITVLMQRLHDHLASGGAVVMTSHQSIPLGYESHLEYAL